ncbi:MAG: UDP-N-acetylmuramoyl-L-alanyl-D-glutamate--2,6-diaminopimelate ligase [Trueperaceae bacterium]|nr:UDP-N-acetylmuramoyl-L-alanyl-D-glutamate--2,6-diaminopimelate ligase [Trueperaceae bacterium]
MTEARPPARTVSLAELLADALGRGADGLPEVRVTGIAQDAARVRPGNVFVARVGQRRDGHDFVADAVARGAACIVGTRDGVPGLAVPYVHVDDDRFATSALAAAFHGHPSRDLIVIGVTGTDGKTTTANVLHHLLQGREARPRASLLSTAMERIGAEGHPPELHFTTPEATEVHAHLAAARDAGVRWAVVEASSHAASLQRLAHVKFDLMAWTNLTPEHLDHHGSLEAYRDAKAGLVRQAAGAVLNRDDPHFAAFADAAVGRITSYAIDGDADLRAEDVVAGPEGLSFDLVTRGGRRRAELPMVGRFNVANALAALAAAHRLGVPWETALERLADFPGVPGRMQLVATEPFTVVVDFAHTPAGLAKALAALRPRDGRRLIVVLGAPGERDPANRTGLGAAAIRGADLAIFTEDDARSEDLERILAALVAGAAEVGGVEGRDYRVVSDRRSAMALALASARPGDVVLLAGKGHERTLERGSGAVPWDEAAEARAALAALAAHADRADRAPEGHPGGAGA